MTEKMIMTKDQARLFSVLLDTLLPVSADGRMPSAGELDFAGYLAGQDDGVQSSLFSILDHFGAEFSDLGVGDRVAAVTALSKKDPEAFDALLFRVYDCYYQNDVVRRLIGSEPGPPFPRGNKIPAGDLSSLETVQKRSKTYRRS